MVFSISENTNSLSAGAFQRSISHEKIEFKIATEFVSGNFIKNKSVYIEILFILMFFLQFLIGKRLKI